MISQNLLKKLENIFSTEVVLKNNENKPVSCISNGSISEENLNSIINDLRIKLPKDYLDFLSFYKNGNPLSKLME